MDNKNQALNEQEVSDEAIAKAMAGELTEEQLKLISDLDKESSVRKLETPWIAKFFYLSCIGVSLYHFITSFVGTPVVLEHRSLHVSMMLALCFVMYPFSKRSNFKRVSWWDWLLVALSLFLVAYVWIDYLGIVERAGMPDTADFVVATLLVLLVLEAARRSAGLALPILSLIFIAYGLFGRSVPGLWLHHGAGRA